MKTPEQYIEQYRLRAYPCYNSEYYTQYILFVHQNSNIASNERMQEIVTML